jgi:hypothetical protein
MDVRLPDGTIIQNVPEGTTKAQLMEKLKANGVDTAKFETAAVEKPRSRADDYQDMVKKRGWGSGADEAIYELGGKVTDLTGSPVAGGITNFLANAIPAALTSGRLADAPAKPLLELPARKLMQNSVKPSQADRVSGAADKALSTMLKENIYPTPGGMDKAASIAGKLDDQVEQAIAKSPAMVNVSDVTSRLQDPMKKFGNQVNPQSDTAALEDVWTKFLTNPQIAGRPEIPVQVAHALKKGTYASLGSKAYGEVGGAAQEGQKALARGLREETANAVPDIVELLKRESSLMNVMDVARARSLGQGNNNLLGLASLRMDHLPSAAMTMADRVAAIKAFIAMQMYGASKPNVAGPLGMAAGLYQNQDDPGILYRK